MTVTQDAIPLNYLFTGYNRFMADTVIPNASAPLQLGDHLALDFLNTTVMMDGRLNDLLRDDSDVLRWLASVGFAKLRTTLPAGSLLKVARTIREALRAAVEQRKAGKPTNWRYWNGLLAKSPSHWTVAADGSSTEQRWGSETAEQILGPVIASAVDLLVKGDFDLIRHCEDHNCVLWFYDRTKSHRRRWCSMGTCGNRNKVAAYRERQQAEA
jgi:predicted RNA-binding Zn ribbon-like protein